VNRTADILAQPHRALLETFLRTPVLVAFDYDGVLAPIAPTPGEARMRPHTRELLTRVAQRYRCEVVSGRALEDLTQRLQGVPLFGLSGNFGREPAGRRPPVRVQAWVDLLRRALAPYEGLLVEDKAYSVTIHYRHAVDRTAARRAIRLAVRCLPGARAVDGIEAVSLMPWPGPTKGSALQEARRRAGCTHAIYIGDDSTDEDAFASASPRHLLAIRVGASSHTQAAFHLQNQATVDVFLETLLACTAATTTSTP
jgi:trehalose 6-phosphate phosphatase